MTQCIINKTSHTISNILSLFKMLGLAITLSISGQLHADNAQGFYAGAGGVSVENRFDGKDSSRIQASELLGGYKYNNALGIELRFGGSIKAGVTKNYVSADNPTSFNQLEREISNFKAVYYRPELVNEEARLYALLGYANLTTQGTVKSSAGKALSQGNQGFSGASYGFGIGFLMSEQLNLNFEYRVLCKELDNKPNALSINLDYRF